MTLNGNTLDNDSALTVNLGVAPTAAFNQLSANDITSLQGDFGLRFSAPGLISAKIVLS